VGGGLHSATFEPQPRAHAPHVAGPTSRARGRRRRARVARLRSPMHGHGSLAGAAWRSAARAWPRLRVRRVRPRGAEREKPAREARSETPLHGRRGLRWQRSLGATLVPCQRHFRSRGNARRRRTAGGPARRERGREEREQRRRSPLRMHRSLADTACPPGRSRAWPRLRAPLVGSAAGAPRGEKTARHSRSRGSARSHRTCAGPARHARGRRNRLSHPFGAVSECAVIRSEGSVLAQDHR
jgi:hypothetical protein